MQRIGVFAGVFDPIHLGHVDFIKRAIKDNGLDKVYLLIEREPKYKKCIAAYDDRKKMLQLALKNIANAEIYETPAEFFPLSTGLPRLKKTHPQARIFILLGVDVAAHINEWEGAQQLLQDTQLIIANRSNDEAYGNVSSLKARRMIAAGKDPQLPAEVREYIKTRGIY